MKILVHENKKRALILALSLDDRKCFEFIDKNHLMFGLYQVWYANAEDRGKDIPIVASLIKAYPRLEAIGWLNIVIDFVPGQTTNLSKEKEDLFGN